MGMRTALSDEAYNLLFTASQRTAANYRAVATTGMHTITKSSSQSSRSHRLGFEPVDASTRLSATLAEEDDGESGMMQSVRSVDELVAVSKRRRATLRSSLLVVRSPPLVDLDSMENASRAPLGLLDVLLCVPLAPLLNLHLARRDPLLEFNSHFPGLLAGQRRASLVRAGAALVLCVLDSTR